MGRVIDLTIEGAHSLGERWRERALGATTEEALNKLVDIISVNERKEGYVPNNLFIDGRRGSGKTTVLLTIKEILSNTSKFEDIPAELKNVHFEVVDDVLDTSVNTMSVTFYFLGWLKEKIEKEHDCEVELKEILYEVINRFPLYLRSCEDSCLAIPEEADLAEKLDKSDLKFSRLLHILIDKFCQVLERKVNRKTFLVLFLDDLDISFPVSRLQRILTEVYMFLSHPRVIIIATGNYSNLVDTITEWVKKQRSSEEANTKRTDGEVAKSFLEKTFAVHAVHIPEVSYELIKNELIVKGKLNGKEFHTKVKDFLEALPIIRLLSFESLPFTILFNGLTMRELVLILKEVLGKIKEYCELREGKFVITEKVLDSRVIRICFSDIYQKVKKLRVVMSYDERQTYFVKDTGKASEINTLMYRLEEAMGKRKLPPIFYEEEKQSVLPLILGVEGKRKIEALFWIWFNENMLFMDGLLTNLPRLLFLEFLRKMFRADKKEDSIEALISFLKMWRNLNYDLKALVKDYFDLYEFLVGMEDSLRVHLPTLHQVGILSPLEEMILVKAGQKYLSLEKLLAYFTEIKMSISCIVLFLMLNTDSIVPLKFMEVEKTIANLTSSLRTRSSIGKLILFEVIYLNFWFRLLSLPRITEQGILKGIYGKEQVERFLDSLEEREQIVIEELARLKRILTCEEEDNRFTIAKVKELFEGLIEVINSDNLRERFNSIWEEVEKEDITTKAYICRGNRKKEIKERIRRKLLVFLLELNSYIFGRYKERTGQKFPSWEVPPSILKILREELNKEENITWLIYKEAFKAPLIRALLYKGLDDADRYLEKLFTDREELVKVKEGIEKDLRILRERSGGDEEAST